MGLLGSAVSWLAGLALDIFLNFVVFWLIMDLLGLTLEILSRVFRIKTGGLFLSPTYNTIQWNREKRERQKIAERAGRSRPIRRTAPPLERTAAAELFALRKKTKRRRGGWPDVHYTAGFRLKDGGAVWLSVREEEFRRLAEGDAGLLTFQGKAFRSFQKFGEGASGP